MNELAANDLVCDPILPVPVIVLLAIVMLALTLWLGLRVGAVAGRWKNLALLLFRLAGIAMVLLLLFQPSRREFLPPPTQERVTVIALDTSLSMKQRDVQGESRFDAARNLLIESGAAAQNGVTADARLKLFGFSDDAVPIEKSVLDLSAEGKSTRFHKSINTLLNSSTAGEAVNAVILLSDGHDLELVNPVKTGTAARARQVPIYAIPFGRQGKVRDVAARISSFQPYCYVKQKARVSAGLRLIGCELEDLKVQLLRAGKVVQTKLVNAGELQELPVEFEVLEPEIGQYEYEIRVQPLENETDAANNSAITYLNVIDQQIRVLLVEGDPYWDTTFLQRSLMRNDKFDVDALLQYGKDRVRLIRKNPSAAPFHFPETLEQFAAYDVILLGRSVDHVAASSQSKVDFPNGSAEPFVLKTGDSGKRLPLAVLDQYVKDRAGTVIFCRGPAFDDSSGAGELQPVIWGGKPRERVRLDVSAEGRGLSAFRTLNDGVNALENLPDLLAGKEAQEIQPLAATLATSAARDDLAQNPAVVHRRYGRGQVVSLGVEGLWRWGLNSQVQGVNTPFDRFWDQMILWLLAGRDFIPNRQFSFRPNSANIALGEKVYFRLTMRQPDPKVQSVPVTLYFGDKQVGRVNMTPSANDRSRLAAEFLPERTGRYRAVANFPDGSNQEARFIVFTENLEETEVATDTLGLRRLCESSGGRLLEPTDLKRLLLELNSEKTDLTPKTRLKPIWNDAWVFYGMGLVFGLDWFLRRRWGLC